MADNGILGASSLKGLVKKVVVVFVTFLAWYCGLAGLICRLLKYAVRETPLVIGMTNFYYELYPENRPVETPADKILRSAYPVFSRVPDYAERLGIVVCENWIAAVGIAVALVVLRVYGQRPVRRVIHSWRGIKPEAMIAGSHFVVGEVPRCQVPLYSVGLLYSSFVGYGLRVEDFLVLPYHVYEAADKQLMFANKVLVTAAPIMSKVIRDLCYIPVAPATWGDLRVPKMGKPLSLTKAMPAGCVGQPGKTSGLVKPTSMYVGSLEYTGSTMPGMSGAAYMDGTGRFLGMHLGAMGQHNVGVTATLITQEIKRINKSIYSGESSEFVFGEDHDLYEDYRFNNRAEQERFERELQWEELEERALDNQWSKDDTWAREEEVDYDFDLDFENAPVLYVEQENDELQPVTIKELLTSLRKAEGKRKLEVKQKKVVKARGQAPGAPEVDLADSFFKTETSVLRTRLDKLEERVSVLEEKMVKQPVVQNPLKLVKCSQCNKVFKSEEFMEQHARDSHTLKQESAFASDNGTRLKVDRKKVPFLGEKRSRQRTSRKFGPTLSTSVKGSPYQSLLESQSKMISILMKLESSLSREPKDMAGQSSEPRQN